MCQISAPSCLLLGLCPLFRLASFAFGKGEFFLLMRARAVHGWVQKAPQLTLGWCLTCCWMENRTSFPGQATVFVHGWESRGWNDLSFFHQPLGNWGQITPMHKVEQPLGLCPPMWATDGAQGGTGAQEQGRACMVTVRAPLLSASRATSNSFPRAMKSLRSASGAILTSLWPLGCPTRCWMAPAKSYRRESTEMFTKLAFLFFFFFPISKGKYELAGTEIAQLIHFCFSLFEKLSRKQSFCCWLK